MVEAATAEAVEAVTVEAGTRGRGGGGVSEGGAGRGGNGGRRRRRRRQQRQRQRRKAGTQWRRGGRRAAHLPHLHLKLAHEPTLQPHVEPHLAHARTRVSAELDRLDPPRCRLAHHRRAPNLRLKEYVLLALAQHLLLGRGSSPHLQPRLAGPSGKSSIGASPCRRLHCAPRCCQAACAGWL